MNRNKGKRYNEGASALTEMEDVSGEDGDQICNTVVEGDNGWDGSATTISKK